MKQTLNEPRNWALVTSHQGLKISHQTLKNIHDKMKANRSLKKINDKMKANQALKKIHDKLKIVQEKLKIKQGMSKIMKSVKGRGTKQLKKSASFTSNESDDREKKQVRNNIRDNDDRRDEASNESDVRKKKEDRSKSRDYDDRDDGASNQSDGRKKKQVRNKNRHYDDRGDEASNQSDAHKKKQVRNKNRDFDDRDDEVSNQSDVRKKKQVRKKNRDYDDRDDETSESTDYEHHYVVPDRACLDEIEIFEVEVKESDYVKPKRRATSEALEALKAEIESLRSEVAVLRLEGLKRIEEDEDEDDLQERIRQDDSSIDNSIAASIENMIDAGCKIPGMVDLIDDNRMPESNCTAVTPGYILGDCVAFTFGQEHRCDYCRQRINGTAPRVMYDGNGYQKRYLHIECDRHRARQTVSISVDKR